MELRIEDSQKQRRQQKESSTKKILRYGYKVVSAKYFKKPFDITIYKFKKSNHDCNIDFTAENGCIKFNCSECRSIGYYIEMKYPYTRWMFDGYKTMVMSREKFKFKDSFGDQYKYYVLEKGVF